MPFHLERVDANNIAHVVALGKELVALGTFGQTGPEFDWDYTLRSTQHVLTNERYYLATAVDDSGAYVGFVAGHLDLFFFAPKLMGIEDCWYVREHTPSRGKIAAALMMSFVDWCSQVFQPHPSDVFSSHAPFHFDLSVLDLYVPLKHGAALVLIDQAEADLRDRLRSRTDDRRPSRSVAAHRAREGTARRA